MNCNCPWDFPGKNTGVGCHFLLQGIFSTQKSNLCLLHLLHWQEDSLSLDVGTAKICKHVPVESFWTKVAFTYCQLECDCEEQGPFSQSGFIFPTEMVSFPVEDFIVIYIIDDGQMSEILTKCLAPPIGNQVYIDLTFRDFDSFFPQCLCPCANLMIPDIFKHWW